MILTGFCSDAIYETASKYKHLIDYSGSQLSAYKQ